jgi:hypothetical protein
MTDRKKQRKHLSGGTLHAVMAAEVRRVLTKYQKLSSFQQRMASAAELGTTLRTLNKWVGPVDHGGWEELQGFGGMDRILGTRTVRKKSTGKKKTSARAASRSTTTTTNGARAA